MLMLFILSTLLLSLTEGRPVDKEQVSALLDEVFNASRAQNINQEFVVTYEDGNIVIESVNFERPSAPTIATRLNNVS
ncbi:unnamed protein product [Caenorhabditis auriculariae]|uniref:Uncharacterized protein n=1 Tax=Caenorhabditis auriculariae TaxID=2777116 RepID=A0A8S1H0A6_9PELO|nr:unnamed protein product [Caenorhabditis auriculariae]